MRTIAALLIALCSIASADSLFQDRFEVVMERYLAFAAFDGLHVLGIEGSSFTLLLHDSSMSSGAVGFSPSNGELAHIDAGTLTFMRAGTWDVIDTVSVGNSTHHDLAFSHDGALVASRGGPASNNKPFSVIDAKSKATVFEPTISATAHSIAFNNDSSLLAVMLGEDLRVWDTSSWTEISTNYSVSSTVGKMEFSKDGELLFLGGDTAPYFWVVETDQWSDVSTGISPSGAVLSITATEGVVAFSVSGDDALFRTYEVGTWNSLESPTANPFRHMEFSRDPNFIAGAGSGASLRMWNRAAGESEFLYSYSGTVMSISLGGGGSNLIMGSIP